MTGFDDLTDVQQDALVDAFGHPDSYEDPSLEKLDDPASATEYEVFRDSLEGRSISQGSMSDEEIDSYKDIGFLREGDEGLEINSVWGRWQTVELEENDMYDFAELDVYVSGASDKPEIAVVNAGDEALIDIEDSLTYHVPGIDSRESAQTEASATVEELSNEFITFFTEGEASGTIYNDAMSSKSDGNITGGENTMTEDYDNLEDVHEAVLSGELTDVDETADLVDEYSSDDPTMSEAYLVATTLEYQALQAGEDIDTVDIYQDAIDRVEDAGNAARRAVSTTATNAWGQINAMEQTEEGVRDAYVTHMLDTAESFGDIAQRDQEEAEDIAELNSRLESVADDLEGVSASRFDSDIHDEVTEELEELREVSDL